MSAMSSSPSALRSRGVRLHAAWLWPEGLASPSTCARVWRGPSVSSSIHLGTKLCSDSVCRNKPRRIPWRLTGAYLLLCFLGNRHAAKTNSVLTTAWTRSLWVQNLKSAPRDLHACTVLRELLRQGGREREGELTPLSGKSSTGVVGSSVTRLGASSCP
jgi:hypothetical protein